MENKNERAYGNEAHNSPQQLLSYFDNHIDKYPDGPKSSAMEINNEKLAPYQDQEEYDSSDDDQQSFDFDSDYEEGYQFLESKSKYI